MGHLLAAAGRDPSFLVGGVTLNFAGNFRVGKGPHFVVEGDEYDTAYFDKGPKFLHYRPRTAILTSVEFDHADIYRDLRPLRGVVRASSRSSCPPTGLPRGQRRLPERGARSPARREGARGHLRRPTAAADVARREPRASPPRARASRSSSAAQSVGEVLLPMGGAHNVENALGVCGRGRARSGSRSTRSAEGFATFQGVKRRQEVRGEIGGVMVIDDFAHHPTAVRETIAAVRHRYPGRPLWAIFEPRSNTCRRNIHQDEYARSFAGAARISLKVPEKHDKVPTGEELDVRKLVGDLQAQGFSADADTDVAPLVARVAAEAKPNDVVLVMSNGAFGGFIDKLLGALEARFGGVK